jgi:hypothetical protein
MEQKPEPLPFIRKVSQGVPYIVRRLVWAAKSGSVETKRRVLTLLRLHDLYYLGIDKSTVMAQLRTIERSPKADPSLIALIKRDLKTILTQMVKKSPRVTIRESALSSMKAGPNGKYAVMHSLEDYVAIKLHNLEPIVTEFSNNVANLAKGQSYTSSYPKWDWTTITSDLLRMKGLETEEELSSAVHTGRLAFLGEKAGKVRCVAIGDYYSQTALKPIHDALMDVLRGIPEDCTFDQQKGAEFLREQSSKGCFLASYDHSSCTDLFPAEMQKDVITELFGSGLGDSWLRIVTERDFKYSLRNHNLEGTVRWSKGQPMGLCSSWPAMAVAHHCLVYYCTKLLGVSPRGKYVILGDDIAISYQPLARVYLDLVEGLGMKINISKSFISGVDTPSCGEFAKRQFFMGEEFTPLPTGLIDQATTDWRLAPLVVRKIREHVSLSLRDCVRWIETVYPKQVNVLSLLLTKPSWLGGFGYKTERPLVEELLGSESSSPTFLVWLKKAIQQESREVIVSDQETEKYFIRLSESLSVSTMREHPFIKLQGGQYPGQDRELGRMIGERLPIFPGHKIKVEEISFAVDLLLRLRAQKPRSLFESRLSISPLDVEKSHQRKIAPLWIRAQKEVDTTLTVSEEPTEIGKLLRRVGLHQRDRLYEEEQLKISLFYAARSISDSVRITGQFAGQCE